ncbi:MAG: porin [Azonexus sp.]
MQKKIIALAIAGLASTAAFAQSNVTIYGSVDMGYSYRYQSMTKGIDSQSSINGGQAQGNRLGFKGVEDLGNGLKAVFLVEQGLGVDASSNDSLHQVTGLQTNRSINYTRQAYAGLAGNFGTLVGGRLYTPHFSFVSAVEPFGAGTVGQYANVFGGTTGGDVVRVDNAVAYISPSFGGFTVTGAYSNNLGGQESLVTNARNTTVYALLGRFQGAGVDAGISMHRAAGASTDAFKSIDNVTIGGSFDAKVVKIAALYGYNNTDFTGSDLRIDNYLVGATIPVGKAAIKLSYIFSDGNKTAGGNAQQLAIGANYALSKRTDIYTAYSTIDNDSADGKTPLVRRVSSVGDAANGGGTFTEGFQVGVRHTF